MNGTGSLVMRAERVGSETLLAQIVRMVGEAQRSRAPIQKLADVVAGYFVPIVVGISALTFVIWALWGPNPRMAHAIVNAVAVLIIACPCALGLATPMSIMVAMGRGATLGVLFKNAEAIELMRKVDTLVVDKTGTLTEGKPQLVSVEPAEGFDANELLRLAATLERGSEHPLAAAIVKGAEDRGVTLVGSAEAFESLTGRGVRGRVDGRAVALGKSEASRRTARRCRARLPRKQKPCARTARPSCSCWWTEKSRDSSRVADPIKADHCRSDSPVARGRHPHRDADRRQPHDGRGRCEETPD